MLLYSLFEFQVHGFALFEFLAAPDIIASPQNTDETFGYFAVDVLRFVESEKKKNDLFIMIDSCSTLYRKEMVN